MKKITLLSTLAGTIIAIAIVLLAWGRDDDSRTARAAGDPTMTPTPGATPTAKPDDSGDLSGLLDIKVVGYDPAASETGGAPDGTCDDLTDNDGDWAIDAQDVDCQDTSQIWYECITRRDHDAVTNEVKVTSKCYTQVQGGDPNSAVPELPGERYDEDGDTVADLDGPPPPPPYAGGAPAKGNGVYQEDYYGDGKGHVTTTTCFPSNGVSLNTISVVDIPAPLVQEAMNGGESGGLAYLYSLQSDAQCEGKAPDAHGGSPVVAAIHATRIEGGGGSGASSDAAVATPNDSALGGPVEPGGGTPTPPDRDYDGDGCTDWQELDKSGAEKCGWDPFNPYDGPVYADDMSGSYSITVTVTEADYDKVLDEPIPGSFYHCLADLQHDPETNDLAERLMCYTDNPLIPVNPEAEADCVAHPEACGDGLAGPAPPGPFADVDDQHAVLTGYVDKVKNTLELEGCFEDRDG